MKGIGLVFAGGGGKGSYEIGVWKYLHEIGLDQYVRAVSGTSVGALNAALFVGSSFEKAERLWLNINQDKILTPREISADDIMEWFVSNGIKIAAPFQAAVSKLTSSAIIGAEKVAQGMLSRVKGDHMFSRDGIVSMISNGLDFDNLRSSDIPCYVTCLRCQGMEIERFILNEYSDDDATTLLLATSAIPVIFPNEEFQGNIYCDGGIPVFGDNVPIKPIYEMGVDTIIVIHLSQETVIDREVYSNAKIIEIVPRENLGNALSGTLDFSPEGAAQRIQLGYEDAKRIMQPMIEMIAMAVENQRMLRLAQYKNEEFEKKRQSLIEKDMEIKEKMKKDEFDNIFIELTKED